MDHRFSIITICRNAETCIERTLSSVAGQTCPAIEYIVVDGASEDDTGRIIEKYRNQITCLISEPDTGIYNAMNKGLHNAHGDILLFLNAGDVLFNEAVIEKAGHIIDQYTDRDIDVFHGKAIMYDEVSGDGYMWASGPYSRFKAFRGAIPHPSTFYSRAAFEKNGIFDEAYKIAGDYEWLVRAVMKNRMAFAYIDLISAVFYKGGISNTPDWAQHLKKEKKKIIKKYYTGFQMLTYRVLNRLRKTFGFK